MVAMLQSLNGLVKRNPLRGNKKSLDKRTNDTQQTRRWWRVFCRRLRNTWFGQTSTRLGVNCANNKRAEIAPTTKSSYAASGRPQTETKLLLKKCSSASETMLHEALVTQSLTIYSTRAIRHLHFGKFKLILRSFFPSIFICIQPSTLSR